MTQRTASEIPVQELMDLVHAWRRHATGDGAREDAVACPACGATGLTIHDRSARPYREWYVLSCGACGLERTVGVSLAAPIPGT